MAAAWIRGTFEGECQGGLAAPQDLTRPDARWYGLALRHGQVRDARMVDVPPEGGAQPPFCQPRLDDCVFVSANGIDDWHQSSVFDVRVHDWKLDHHVEANNHTWAVMRGTLYARVDDGAPEPKVVVPRAAVVEDDIGPVTVLAVLAWMAWLLFRCGWVTCCVWAVPVALSHWRWKVTPRADATRLTKGLHAVAGLGLFVLAVGILGVAAGEERCELTLWLPGAFLLVCMFGASVLVVASPVRAIWLVWSVFVATTCLRSDDVCLAQPAEYWRSAVAQLGPLVGGAGGAGDKGAGDKGAGDKGAGDKGAGDKGAGDKSAGDKGASGTGSGGDGSGSGGDGSGSGGDGSGSGGDGSGSGGDGSGSGGDGTGGDGDGVGAGGDGGTAQGKDGAGRGDRGGGRDGGVGGTGDRISVDEALSDPEKFYEQRQQPVRLQGDLLFDFDSDQLKPSAEPQLRQLADLLRMRDERRVVLEGHSDGIGGATHNQRLSERRAAAVRDHLIHQEHINPGRLEAQGFGSKRPVVPLSGDRAAQRPNRRVELRVVE